MDGNAVVYLRVSTEDQADSGLGVEAQEAACRAFADRNGWPISATFRDLGVSGSKPLEKRPGLIAAVETIGRGSVLLVAKRDRLFRTSRLDGALIEYAITSRGGRIASAAGEGTEDDSPASQLVAGILDLVGANERLNAISRTKAAMKAKRDRGERCGQVPYGFRLGADGRSIEPEPDDLRAVELAGLLAADGRSLRAIAAELTTAGLKPKNGGAAWSASTIRRMLKRGEDGTCPGI